MDPEQLLQDFPGRNRALARIPRFSFYPTMHYRSNLLSHSRRVAWLIREVAPLTSRLYPDFNPERAELLALVHDDAELFTGDVQAGIKSKMSAEELRKLKDAEITAIDGLTLIYPEKIGAFDYRELLLDSAQPETIDAQVVKYVDKFDALGEALHEIFSGNELIVTHFYNEYGKISVPLETFQRYAETAPLRTARLHPLLESGHTIFTPLPPLDVARIIRRAKPHTRQSFRRKTGYAPYDLWKEVILKNDSGGELDALTTQREQYRIEPKE